MYHDRRKNISIIENKKKYVLHNIDERLIGVFHVDDGMIKDKTEISVII